MVKVMPRTFLNVGGLKETSVPSLDEVGYVGV